MRLQSEKRRRDRLTKTNHRLQFKAGRCVYSISRGAVLGAVPAQTTDSQFGEYRSFGRPLVLAQVSSMETKRSAFSLSRFCNSQT
jgi:hypothetical protein